MLKTDLLPAEKPTAFRRSVIAEDQVRRSSLLLTQLAVPFRSNALGAGAPARLQRRAARPGLDRTLLPQSSRLPSASRRHPRRRDRVPPLPNHGRGCRGASPLPPPRLGAAPLSGGPTQSAAAPASPEGPRVSLITSSETPPPATLPFMLQPEGEVGWRCNRFRFLGRRRRAAPRSSGSCSPPGRGRAGPGGRCSPRAARCLLRLAPAAGLAVGARAPAAGRARGGREATVSSARVRLTRQKRQLTAF